MNVELLSRMGCGEKGKIIKIRGKAGMHRHLLKLGMAVGRTISIEKISAAIVDDPIAIRTKSNIFTLAKIIAANIEVEVA